eukprot:6206597-Pleurochrysis_carterae.AAC.1
MDRADKRCNFKKALELAFEDALYARLYIQAWAGAAESTERHEGVETFDCTREGRVACARDRQKRPWKGWPARVLGLMSSSVLAVVHATRTVVHR